MIDIFAWIVLLILVASGIAIFFIAGSLPGHIAKKSRPPLGAGRHRRGLGNADLRFCAVAGRADLGLCRRARRAKGGAAMIVAILNVYLVILFYSCEDSRSFHSTCSGSARRSLFFCC